MSVNDKINQVKDKLDKLKRDHRFKKANKERAIEAELTYDIVKCAGDLGACKKEFFYTIKDQSEFIRKGRAESYNTAIQETQLRDAAIGYMLVKDALFALQSITSYDSVTHAYDLLDAATKKITGEKVFPFFKDSKKKKPKRDEYGFINSAEAVEAKAGIVDSFFERLIETGDIDLCIKEAQEKSASNPFTDGEVRLPNLGTDVSIGSEHSDTIKEMRRSALYNTAPPDPDK